MYKFNVIFRHVIFASGLCLSPLFAAAPHFAHESSDLKHDPAAKFGVLENGLRYVIYPNQEPKGRASLRLLVRAGSLYEEENQRGVAHFLEHMAFNGSKPWNTLQIQASWGCVSSGNGNGFYCLIYGASANSP